MLYIKFCCYAKEPAIICLLNDQHNHVIVYLRSGDYSLNTFAPHNIFSRCLAGSQPENEK